MSTEPTVTPEAGAAGQAAAGADVVQLDPVAKARKQKADKERMRELARLRSAKHRAKAAAGEAAEPKAAREKPAPGLTPEERDRVLRQLAIFVRLPWWIATFVAGLFGYTAEKLTRELAAEHAEHWLVYAEAAPGFRRILTLTIAPVLLVADFLERVQRKPEKPA